MLTKTNHTGRIPAIVTLICAATMSMAFGADESLAQVKGGHAQDPLFLTATNGANNMLAVVNTRTRQTDFVPDRRLRRGRRQRGRRGSKWPDRGSRQLRILHRYDLYPPG